jgi:Zn-dependent protease with chaperone function
MKDQNRRDFRLPIQATIKRKRRREEGHNALALEPSHRSFIIGTPIPAALVLYDGSSICEQKDRDPRGHCSANFLTQRSLNDGVCSVHAAICVSSAPTSHTLAPKSGSGAGITTAPHQEESMMRTQWYIDRWRETLRQIVVIGTLGAAIILAGCATNTITGRSQLSLVSEESISRQSVTFYSSMVSSYGAKEKLIKSGPVKERVDRITNRLIAQAVLYRPESAKWNWQVSVIDDPKTVNAFCMPGGLMGIYTGFFEQIDATDDEIAQVMGHEIGHALAGHSAEKMSVQLASNMVVMVLSAATAQSAQDFQNRHAAMTVGALAFVNRPNSRELEFESDRIGVELAARAGFNPEAAVTLWKKMAKLNGGTSNFMSTHPSSEKRAQELEAMQPPMRKILAKANAGGYQGHTGHGHDWLNAPHSTRPVIDSSKAIPLYSPSWDAFANARVELAGSNVPVFVVRQRGLKELYDKRQWRDLALSVMEIDFNIDLSYHYLGMAALGLGFEEAGQHYLLRARAISQMEKTSCARHMIVSCSGFDPSKPVSSVAVGPAP